MPILKSIFIVILLLFMTSLVKGQKRRQYTFTHYTTSSGLVSNQVYSVVQDTKGYIWIATVDGLQRFDGIRYKTFRHKEGDQTTISSNAILQLMMDKRNNLWLLMSNGEAGIFDTEKFIFHKAIVHVKHESSLTLSVKQLITDEPGNIFMLFGDNELLTWNQATNTF